MNWESTPKILDRSEQGWRSFLSNELPDQSQSITNPPSMLSCWHWITRVNLTAWGYLGILDSGEDKVIKLQPQHGNSWRMCCLHDI